MDDENIQIGDRRATSWWSPTFSPELHGKLTVGTWSFRGTTGPEKCFLSASVLADVCKSGTTAKFLDLTFSECDFQGEYNHKPSILFDRCRFRNCDFGFSAWTRATFRECEFVRCSFSLASFTECEFRDCKWERMGFSGSKTDFSKCFVTNPTEFVSAGFSGLLREKSTERRHRAYQAYRLEETKAHVARSLMGNHEAVSDDRTFYETARLHDLQQVRFRLSKSGFDLRFGNKKARVFALVSAIYWITDLLLLYAVGLTNGWGARVLQPLLLLVATYIFFALSYRYLVTSSVATHPWLTAFDVAVIAGFTNQTGSEVGPVSRWMMNAQLVLTIFFYTIFFSTAVARFSRSR